MGTLACSNGSQLEQHYSLLRVDFFKLFLLNERLSMSFKLVRPKLYACDARAMFIFESFWKVRSSVCSLRD